jgi:transcriptional regulator with XRE-family HTH domain
MRKEQIRMNMKKIGNALRSYRSQRDLSQQRLAAMVRSSQSTIARIECGTNLPNLQTLYQLCDALNCSITQFFLETERVG